MELKYTFDPERFYLGTPCIRGHFWPGTQLSLRRLYFSPQGVRVNHCVECTGGKTRDWKIRFIDHEAMGIANGKRLGKLCKAGHKWNDLPITLRDKHDHCIECEKKRKRNQRKSNPKKYREYGRAYLVRLGAEEVRRRERERYMNMSADKRAERMKRKREHRATLQSKGLTIRGTQRVYGPPVSPLQSAIRKAGRNPAVAQLVATAQREYWKEHPEAYREYAKQRNKDRHRWLQMTSESYRLYQRQKSKRRKAQMRDSVAIQIKGRQVRERFRQFDNRCAYCGCTGDLHIEHVVPISKGGTHAIGNIIPACKDCNFSKAANEAESWYKAQPFFSELRWRKICRVLGWGRSSVGQLALL